MWRLHKTVRDRPERHCHWTYVSFGVAFGFLCLPHFVSLADFLRGDRLPSTGRDSSPIHLLGLATFCLAFLGCNKSVISRLVAMVEVLGATIYKFSHRAPSKSLTRRG